MQWRQQHILTGLVQCLRMQHLPCYSVERLVPPILNLYTTITSNLFQRLTSSLGDNAEPTTWAMTENCTGIVGASLPAMRPIYQSRGPGIHYSLYETHCSRGEHPRITGRRSRLRGVTNWPASASSFAGEGTQSCQEAQVRH